MVALARCGAADEQLETLEATARRMHLGEHGGLFAGAVVKQEAGEGGTLAQADAVAGSGTGIRWNEESRLAG